ncbi:MAG: hypothetical protein KDI71_06555 [Xanthomonadales bacterium]|nr:hypothetical protein [Xanthomonadales bacterium]
MIRAIRCAPLLLAFLTWTTSVLAESGSPSASHIWSVSGGQLRMRLDPALLAKVGIDSVDFEQGLETDSDPRPGLAIVDSGALEFSANNDSIQAFVAGRLPLHGELRLSQGSSELALRGASIQPGASALALRVVDGGGAVWFDLDHLHFHLLGQSDEFRAWNIDIRISQALAQRLGQPLAEGEYLGQAELLTRFRQTGPIGDDPEYCQPIRWPGTLIDSGNPDGDRYEADVTLNGEFLNNLTVNALRCETETRACDGPGGVDARMVIAPSAELRNTNNLNTAAIPWYRKFSGVFPPYGNDQHPFLVWNIYRIEDGGKRLRQVGRSAVKHAYLTANSGCGGGCPNTHPQNNFQILWPNCQDTYGTGDNDNSTHLGPRSEILPHAVIWGRCGSIYDADCNGQNDFPTVGDFDYRTQILESAIDPALHPGASFHIEAWYLIREDQNIFNSMGTRRFLPIYSSAWFLSTSGQNFAQGPMIDKWADPAAVGQMERNRLLSTTEGQVKLGVKVEALAGGEYRYEYALANFDLARAVTSGFEPNLRVVSNRGLIALELPMPATASLSNTDFFDGDQIPDNGWEFVRDGDVLRIQGPPENPLNWATMFSFGFQTDQPPAPGLASLPMAEAGTPAAYQIATIVPNRPADTLLADSMEAEGP